MGRRDVTPPTHGALQGNSSLRRHGSHYEKAQGGLCFALGPRGGVGGAGGLASGGRSPYASIATHQTAA
ncbi:Protein of unknown function [Gryllus bimaculatus]|nr:Protein of unknown function [Gryllus bimaculatus]